MLERPDNLFVTFPLLFAATWRLTHLLMYETGPYKVLERLREATGVVHDSESGRPIAYPEGNVFECFWCLSIWVSIVILPIGFWAWPAVLVLALSATAIWIEVYGPSRH